MQQTITPINIDDIEKKDSLLSSKSSGFTSVNNNISTINSSSLYNSSMQISPSFYSTNIQHQQNLHHPSSLQMNSEQTSSSFHDLYTRIQSSVSDDSLTNSSPSSSHVLISNNPSLSMHSPMNVSLRNPTTTTSFFFDY